MAEINKYGIGFWIGALVYSIINMIFNYKQVLQSEVLIYNYIISGAAVVGLLLNVILLRKDRK